MTRSIDPEDLTGPERAAARAQGKRAREQVNACGGCACCLHRDRATEGWNRALCGLKPPATFKDKDCTFAPDYDVIYRDSAEQN